MVIKNEGLVDRFIRGVLGEIFLLAGYFWVGGTLAAVLMVIGVIFVVTALVGFCGLYRIFGISTCPVEDAHSSKIKVGILLTVLILIPIVGSYYSNFFTKKFFLENFNRMNAYYKQTLFFTGQEKRGEAIENYDKLTVEYQAFKVKYQTYHPYALKGDTKLNSDLEHVSSIIVGLQEKVQSGDLKSAHLDLEQVRPVFQDIFKRNNFSLLAVALVDFHDAMEKIITTSDEKDVAATIAVYGEVNEKLKAVEEMANDAEIQTIREKLDAVKALAEQGQTEALPGKASELKSAFVKVYLKRG